MAAGPWSLEVTPADFGLSWCSLRTVDLDAGKSLVFDSGEEELLILSLCGSCTVRVNAAEFELNGRLGVFHGASDFVYIPCGAEVVISSARGGRFALPGARARRQLPARYVPATEVSVEFLGAGCCSRQKNNYCTPGQFEAERLIACEVLTPGGNWSSYPPHKHDEERPGESNLEEIYYFEVAEGPAGSGVAYYRGYGTPSRPLDVLAEVRSGDVALLPHGWHGPAMAAPGFDLYYLNVMAGPGQRTWLISDDPTYGWVRSMWSDLEVDPRLPFQSACDTEPTIDVVEEE
jgi:5-deoxy-glucuronate isomerase